jgi:hypothetical protein
MDFMNSLDRLPLVRRRLQAIAHMNAPDHKNVSLELDFSRSFRSELVVASIDMARLQRASECPRQSTGRRSDDVVERGRMRRICIRRNLVVLGDLGVNAKDYRLFLRGQISEPHGTGLAFNPHARRIDDVIRPCHFTTSLAITILPLIPFPMRH